MQGEIRWRGHGDPLQELAADMIWQRQRMFMVEQHARDVHPGHNVLDGNPVTLLPDDEAGRPAYLACLPRISETRISSALRTDSAGLIAALGWSTDIGYGR